MLPKAIDRPMPSPMSAPDVLNREFLLLRAKILEIGAMLDRMDRADGDVAGDPRMQTVRRALAVLQAQEADRAEKIQRLFSLPYDEHWRDTFGIASRPTITADHRD